ncbi:MAG: type II secretion system F family protein [Candidatus Poseidoniaceae archaeon]|jgi:flagellar protein FlaJ|nr:type II secretion system F family protein [Candidatus Poseidoniaceae archaeon]
MARKKKNKIIVDLDLPKNDSTMTKLYAILMVCGFIGLGCFGFWITNSHFTTSPNGQPLFVNLACGFDSSVELTPTLNDTCPMLEDEATPIVYESLEPWIEFREQGQYFDVPGRNISELNGAAPPVQPFTATCNIDSSLPADYSFRIHDIDGQVVARHDGNSHDENDKCHLHVENMEVGNMYSVVIMSNEEINSATYRFEMDYFDGTPEYINNKSLWIGPEVNLGGVSLRPTIFLNFFGFGFFMCFWPASFYWDRVKTRINDMEEKFPDFLRDLAEYWKGGLSMTVAVQTLAKSEYGALNDEVKKMSDQLSWGVAFSDVIHMFAERVGTPLVRRAISLISEANRAGGKISDILVTAANDSREIKFLERERIRSIASYISVIWTSYGVFLGVIVVLAKVFIPAIAGSNSEPSEGGESGGAAIGNMVIRNIEPLFFLTIFYYGVTMQALGNGNMAGLMATGRFSSGMKHAGLMILLSLLCFNFIVYTPDLIGITTLPGFNVSAGVFRP